MRDAPTHQDIFLYRGLGHPWTCEPGWDQMYIGAESLEQLRERIAAAAQKFWKVWFLSEPTLRVHLFKPSGATRDWQDVPWQGTPRAHGHQFKVGDKVYTDFASTRARQRITEHVITDIELHPLCQTGVRFRVSPPVPGGSHISDDPGRAAKVHKTPWIDSAWFRAVPA